MNWILSSTSVDSPFFEPASEGQLGECFFFLFFLQVSWKVGRRPLVGRGTHFEG